MLNYYRAFIRTLLLGSMEGDEEVWRCGAALVLYIGVQRGAGGPGGRVGRMLLLGSIETRASGGALQGLTSCLASCLACRRSIFITNG